MLNLFLFFFSLWIHICFLDSAIQTFTLDICIEVLPEHTLKLAKGECVFVCVCVLNA